MIKKIAFSMLVAFFGVQAFAQHLKTISVPLGARTENTVIVDGVAVHSYSGKGRIPINGTPYFNKKFMPGVLQLKDGRISEDILLRYDVANDAFEISANNDTMTINKPYQIERVFLNDRVFIFDPRLRPNTERKYNGFFELAVEDKMSLYIKRIKDMKFDSFASNYQGGSGTKEYYYVEKTTYVGQIANEKPFLIHSTKSFLRNIEKNKEEVKKFIKDNRLKVKKEEDLKQIVGYYNSL